MSVYRGNMWSLLKSLMLLGLLAFVYQVFCFTLDPQHTPSTTLTEHCLNEDVTLFKKNFAHDYQPEFALDPNLAPNTVFVVWCGQPRWFLFRHYVTIMSVIRNMRPDNLVFYYENLPVVDNMNYNTWFDELRQQYPFLSLIPLDDVRLACDVNGIPKRKFILNVVSKFGGMYIGENTMLSRFPGWVMAEEFVFGLEEDPRNGVVVAQRNVSLPDNIEDLKLKSPNAKCSSSSYVVAHINHSFCVVLDEEFSPESIWEDGSPLGNTIRWAVYGSPTINRAEMSSDDQAPNIAHMIWINGKPMDYLFYLCVLSALYIGQFDKVYLHCDTPPTGPYWDKIKSHDNIVLIHRNSLGRSIYGNKVKRIAHWSDAVRVEIMLKYGGIYIDTDLLIVRPLSRELLNYDVTATYDFPDRTPFPNSFSCGFMIGKKHAKFWYLFQESMKWFQDKNWEWNGLLQPYKVMERHPGLVHTERHIQVICLHGLCHPTWWPDHNNVSYHHLNSGLPLNWRKDANIFHFCGKYPKAFHNETMLMESNDMFGEMGRYVLEKAGVL